MDRKANYRKEIAGKETMRKETEWFFIFYKYVMMKGNSEERK